ncbi:MAG: biotin--[acetyl-CoA-carboxylase] ligase [Treponema sp.]|jgi:BirA family biotin operon repressor/biotin-[acetyl-CoA-carboxylase] ligase|nr:biotin--[acetyl-CoA-carboxylase] ligase [Treponema sp.]
MDTISIKNPFDNAPVFYMETVSSAMDASRELAAQGFPHGTVIAAGSQSAGRGRMPDRVWRSAPGNVYCAILLRYTGFQDIPQPLSLKAGLAAASAVEDFIAALPRGARPAALVKWPNDIMLCPNAADSARAASGGTSGAKKVAGVLIESDGKTVFIGIGVNVAQTQFPEDLRNKATSVALACGVALENNDRFRLLEKLLSCLYRELRQTDDSWRERLSGRLYLKDAQVRFIAGKAGSGEAVEGILRGVGKDGALLLLRNETCGGADEVEAFLTGELDVYPRERPAEAPT